MLRRLSSTVMPAAEHAAVHSDRPVVAFFDVDNTLLQGASVYHVSRAAWRRGYVGLRDLLLFSWQQARFMAVGENKEHIHSAQERALLVAKGHPSGALKDLAEDIYEHDLESRLWPETVELTREHLARGHEVWLITAAPVDIASVIATRLGLTGALGTTLRSKDGVLTGELEGPILHGERKVVAANELVSRLGADLSECWAYSDSSNDLPLLQLVGHRVVVNPDAKLLTVARENGWSVMKLDPASIRSARAHVRREARRVRRGDKKRQAR